MATGGYAQLDSDTGRVLSSQSNSGTVYKSYTFTTQGLGAGTRYFGGFYEAPATDANLTQASATVNLGSSGNTYGAHAFLVAGGVGTASGGTMTGDLAIDGIHFEYTSDKL